MSLFLCYDGTYGHTDKVLGFIQQFDAAFGGEYFTKSSKLRHIAMYFQKSARHWWASLRTKGIAPKTWKACREAIMKQFLMENAKDDVLTSWWGLKFDKGETMQRYVDKFWDLHLKASIFKSIDFVKQKQQNCAGLPKDMKTYVNAQKPTTISEVIHHYLVAAKIFPSNKVAPKPMEKGKKGSSNDCPFKDQKSNNNKKKDKGEYRGKNKLSPEELECYKKENCCFKCSVQGHNYRNCP